MSSRKTSEIWNHFSEKSDGKVKCHYCNAFISARKGSTGNMNRHLRMKHPGVSKCREKFIQEDNNEYIDPDDPPPSSSSEATNDKPETSSKSLQEKPKNKIPRQENLENFLVNVKPIPINKSKQFDQQLVRMVVKEYHPFSVVEDIEFKKFVNMLCPGYNLPSRKTLSESLVPQTFNKIRESVKENVTKAFAVCITTDSWTSINNESFIGVTAHWLDDSGGASLILRANLLDCITYNDRHTAVNLCEFLQNRFEDWNIQNNISAIVSDNAHNIVAAVKQGNWRHLGCFAHTVNLIVQKAVKEIEETLFKIRKIVEFFKRSSRALFKLNQTQEQMGQQILKLKLDVCTRWNSTLDMLIRFCQRKDAILSTLAVLQHDVTLSNIEWEIANHAIDILKIFSDVTEEIGAEKNVTISKILLFINTMENHVLQSKNGAAIDEIKKMIDVLLKEIYERFKNMESNELVAQAVILDPRFKKYGFKDQSKANQAIEKIKQMLKSNITPNLLVPQVNENTTSVEKENPSCSKSLLWNTFDEKVQKFRQPHDPTAAAILEVDKYINEPLLSRHEDPLLWWFQRKNIYPHIYKIVKKRLCITATSVPCERIFSKAGQVLTEKRNRLKASKTNQILFLHVNL